MVTAPVSGAAVLRSVPGLAVREHEPLARHTRFSIGGPARIYAEASTPDALRQALAAAAQSGLAVNVIGGGSNLIVSDSGFDGLILRYTASRIDQPEAGLLHAEAGADLQALVDRSIDLGLANIHTMTGIPGTVGGAVYGNAGAYGHSVSETLESATFLDSGVIRTFDNAACQFAYRESIFKRRKDWIILSAAFRLPPGDAAALRTTADGILATRNQKYPPEMKCAGSIFKNLILAELPSAVRARVPASVIREGKVPSAWFLEQAGAKGLRRGGIEVASYHANLIYNTGTGASDDLQALIAELKQRVLNHFGLVLTEEVQYVG